MKLNFRLLNVLLSVKSHLLLKWCKYVRRSCSFERFAHEKETNWKRFRSRLYAQHEAVIRWEFFESYVVRWSKIISKHNRIQ